MKRVLLLLCIAALLAGCTQPGNKPATDPDATAATVPLITEDEMFTDRDRAGTYEQAQEVTLSGGDYTITEAGTYLFRGSLTEGSIIVKAGDTDKVQLVLAGVEISCSTNAPICILSGDKVFITLAEGTTNTLTGPAEAVTVGEYNINAALYSRSDLAINGTGSLTIHAPGGHGISCKDDLVITGGTVNITAAGHGLDANDSVRIGGGTVTADAGKDGIHAENTEDATKGFVYISGGTLDLEAEGDGISAGAWLQYGGGALTVLAGGGYENGSNASSDGYGQMGGMHGPGGRPPHRQEEEETAEDSQSMKGLKAAGEILIGGGTLKLDTADDAIHSHTNVTIGGGNFTIASGDDGVHGEDTLTITACEMTISEAYEGLEAQKIHIRGGTVWMHCSDDGLNAAGGADASGTEGGRDGMFGGGQRPGGMGGGMGGMGADPDALIAISGGKLTIYSGGDAVDSNGNMTMTGGYVYATNYRTGDVSVLDSQNRPVITGGTYIGLGMSTMMAESFSEESGQGVIACTCGDQPAGSVLTIKDSKGNTLLELESEYNTAIMIISSPQIEKGQSYTVSIGTVSGTVEAD